MLKRFFSPIKLVVAALIIFIAATSLGKLLPAHSCCSLARAELSSTFGWVGDRMWHGQYVHILAYQNKMQNLSKVNGEPTGNAMFLPIPAQPGTMTEANMLDTSQCKNFLVDMAANVDAYNQAKLVKQNMGLSAAGVSKDFVPQVQVFDRGPYTVVLAQHASEIPAALKNVPASKRPPLNQKIFAAYEKWYPNWTFALCCFNNNEMRQADPMLWWYKPMNPHVLFFPALDCHTGEVPSLTASVLVDHCLMASSPSFDRACDLHWFNLSELFESFHSNRGPYVLHSAVQYSNWWNSGLVRDFMPKYVHGYRADGELPQGDFVIDVGDLVACANPYPNQVKERWRRILPPGATSTDAHQTKAAN